MTLPDKIKKQLDELRNKYADRKPDGFVKYCDYDYLMPAKQKAYDSLEISGKIKVLDISTGFGYFPYICKENGHSVVVTDPPGEVCAEARDILGLPRAVEFVYHTGREDLPVDIGMFDLITAFAVGPMGTWPVDNWGRYIIDCKRHLNKGGRIYIEVNKGAGRANLSALADYLGNGYIIWT